MKPLRTIFKNEIVAEFLPPKKRLKKEKVIIFCDGMPSVPSKRTLLEFFSQKNFWVFQPRYRGSWESQGQFLKKSPHLDILDVISSLPKGFKNLWTDQEHKIQDPEVYVFASSFGGPAALLVAEDPRIEKVVAFSPVVDWQVPSPAEPLPWLFKFMKVAFGSAYRVSNSNWKKLSTGKFYNPVKHAKTIPGKKVMIFHAKDDPVIPWKPVEDFASKIGATFVLSKTGGHISSSHFSDQKFYKKISQFIKK